MKIWFQCPVSRSGFKVRTARPTTERPVRCLELDREPVHLCSDWLAVEGIV